MDTLDRIINVIVGTTCGRHNRMNTVLRYLPQRMVWWSGWAIMTALWGIEWLPAAPLLGGVFVLMRLTRHLAPKAQPSISTLLMWETILWWDTLNVGLTGAGVFIDRSTIGNMLQYMGLVAIWVIGIYLYIDLFFPPRKRKRIKLPERAKSPIPVPIT